MIRPPLFGKDSSPQYTAPRLSAIITAGLSVVFLLLVIFIPEPKQKPKTEPIRIVLEPPPQIELEKEYGETSDISESADTETASPSEEAFIEEAPSSPEPVNPEPVTKEPEVPVKKVETPKEQPKAQETKPVEQKVETPKKEEPKWTKRTDNNFDSSKFIGDEIDFSVNKKTGGELSNSGRDEFDPWAQFDDDDIEVNTSSSNKTVQEKIDGTKALQGSVGTASTKATEKQSSSQVSNSSTQDTSDSEISNAIKDVANTSYKEKTYKGSNSSIKMKSAETSSGTSVSMNDGSKRILLHPSTPSISLSSDIARTIDTEPTVTITIEVLSDGSVPDTRIEIKGSAVLSKEIIEEIKKQLASWKFQAGTAKATASFDFTIKKK